MAERFSNTRVSYGDFEQSMAVVYAFLSGDADVAEKIRVIAKVSTVGDQCVGIFEEMLHREKATVSFEYLSDLGKTSVSKEKVIEAGNPKVGDAISAAVRASDIKRILDAREKLEKVVDDFDSEESTVDKVLIELGEVSNTIANRLEIEEKHPYEVYLERERREPGIQTFISQVDDITLGISPGKVLTVAAYTGHAKSTCAKNMAYLNAKIHDVKSVFFTMEEPCEDVLLSFVVRHSLDAKWQGKPPLINTQVINTSLREEQKAFFKEVADDWVTGKHTPIHVCGLEHLRGSYTIPSVISLIKSFKPYGAVFIDYMQIFKTFNIPNVFGEYEKINYATARIRNEIALDSDPVPLVQCAQIGRKGFDRVFAEEAQNSGRTKGYVLSDLSEANELEKGSAYVVTLYLNDDLRYYGRINVQFLKGRGSAIIETPFEVGFAPQHFLVGGEVEEVQVPQLGVVESTLSDISNLIDR